MNVTKQETKDFPEKNVPGGKTSVCLFLPSYATPLDISHAATIWRFVYLCLGAEKIICAVAHFGSMVPPQCSM
jgi:hypothetical protein